MRKEASSRAPRPYPTPSPYGARLELLTAGRADGRSGAASSWRSSTEGAHYGRATSTNAFVWARSRRSTPRPPRTAQRSAHAYGLQLGHRARREATTSTRSLALPMLDGSATPSGVDPPQQPRHGGTSSRAAGTSWSSTRRAAKRHPGGDPYARATRTTRARPLDQGRPRRPWSSSAGAQRVWRAAGYPSGIARQEEPGPGRCAVGRFDEATAVGRGARSPSRRSAPQALVPRDGGPAAGCFALSGRHQEALDWRPLEAERGPVAVRRLPRAAPRLRPRPGPPA